MRSGLLISSNLLSLCDRLSMVVLQPASLQSLLSQSHSMAPTGTPTGIAESTRTRPATKEPIVVNLPEGAETSVSPSEVNYHDEREQRNSRLRIVWDNTLEEVFHNPSFYDDVSSLLISFDDDLDDLHTKEEVRNIAPGLGPR